MDNIKIKVDTGSFSYLVHDDDLDVRLSFTVTKGKLYTGWTKKTDHF